MGSILTRSHTQTLIENAICSANTTPEQALKQHAHIGKSCIKHKSNTQLQPDQSRFKNKKPALTKTVRLILSSHVLPASYLAAQSLSRHIVAHRLQRMKC